MSANVLIFVFKLVTRFYSRHHESLVRWRHGFPTGQLFQGYDLGFKGPLYVNIDEAADVPCIMDCLYLISNLRKYMSTFLMVFSPFKFVILLWRCSKCKHREPMCSSTFFKEIDAYAMLGEPLEQDLSSADVMFR
jgi:hypothetical protein